MSFEYRLVVLDGGDGSSKVTITNTNAIFSVDEYNLTPDGNCLEATFRLLPKSISPQVALRDVITIETRPNSSASWTSVYRGYVVLAGNPRSDNVETYRLIGMKQRFYETILRDSAYIAGDDVAGMADEVFDLARTAQGASLVGVDLSGSRDLPALTFSLGDRIPLLESAGAALDSLASTVGRFLVPTGDTYVYDGVTFTAGQTVPAVTWGVRADGEIFFRRATSSIGSFAETDLDVDVTYPALSGEDVAEAPVLVYYPGTDKALFEALRVVDSSGTLAQIDPVWIPIAYQPTQTNTTHVRVQVPNPDDFVVDCAGDTYSYSGSPNNALDGNPATKVDITSTTGDFQYFVDNPTPGVVIRFDVAYGGTSGLLVIIGFSTAGVGATLFQARLVLNDQLNFARRVFYLPVPLPVQAFQRWGLTSTTRTYSAAVSFLFAPGPSGSGGTAFVYDARPFNVQTETDDSQAMLLQELFTRPVVDEVTNVKVFGEEPLFTKLALTPQVGSAIDVPVERVQYSITTAEGVTTTYHAGQAFDGQLVSERVVLEGLARRAVRS